MAHRTRLKPKNIYILSVCPPRRGAIFVHLGTIRINLVETSKTQLASQKEPAEIYELKTCAL